MLWAQRHHKGTTSLAEHLASPKVKPKLEAQLAALQKRCASGDLGAFTPWQLRRESGQVVIGTDAEALAGQLALQKHLEEWFVQQHKAWSGVKWPANLTERLAEPGLGVSWSLQARAAERSRSAAAQFIDQVAARVGESDSVTSWKAVSPVLERASLTERARLHLLGLIAHDVQAAIGEKLADGPSEDEADSGLAPYSVSLREAIAQQVRVEKTGSGHGVVLNVPAGLFGKVDAMLKGRLEAAQKYFVEDRQSAFEAAHPQVLTQGGFTAWSAQEVATKKRLRERVARAAVLEETARPGADLVSLVNTRGNPIRHRTLNPLGGNLVAALRSALAKFVAETDGVDAERTRYEVDGSASEVGELMIAGLDSDAEHPKLVKAVTGAKHTLAGNVTVGPKVLEGVVAFMLELGLEKRCNGITLDEFKDADSPVGWDKKVNGKSHNKEWLKDRFRAADSGSHEWIPSNLMLEMIERAESAPGAIKGAKWILAQHWLRSPTTQIIFEPSKYSDEWKAFQDADEEHLAAMTETRRSSA